MKLFNFLFRSKFTNMMSIGFYTFVLLIASAFLFVMNALFIVMTVEVIQAASFYEGIVVLVLTLLAMWFLNRMFPVVLGFKAMFNDVKHHMLMLFNKKIIKE
ncbi:hypothetical protein [Staphylococcus aureus]